MKSFSRPWNASTLAISTSYKGHTVTVSQLAAFKDPQTVGTLLRCTVQSHQGAWDLKPAEHPHATHLLAAPPDSKDGAPLAGPAPTGPSRSPAPLSWPSCASAAFLTVAICFPIIKACVLAIKDLRLDPS